MTSNRGAALLWMSALFFVLSLHGAAQSDERYKARLSPVPVDAGMRSTVAGSGSATATLKGDTLTISGTFDGLLSPATTARVHRGAAKGLRGSSFAELTASKAAKGTIAGSITLTPDQVQALKNGQIYIQLSSEKAQDGNLWGWLVR